MTRETAFNATIGEATEQVEALDTNTVTIGATTYVKLTASTYDVETTEGYGVVMDDENVIYFVNDGVPESTNYSIIDPETPDTPGD